jgi:hypothetical protein
LKRGFFPLGRRGGLAGPLYDKAVSRPEKLYLAAVAHGSATRRYPLSHNRPSSERMGREVKEWLGHREVFEGEH